MSTEEQSLERQMKSVAAYAERKFDASLGDLEIYRDKSTGTKTARQGYVDMMQAVEEGNHEVVLVHGITRLARSVQDLEKTVDRIVETNAELHLITNRLVFNEEDNPQNRLMMHVLSAFAEFEAEILKQRTKQGIAARQAEGDYHHGRPPFGYNKDDGKLIPGPDYDRICAILEAVEEDRMSKRKAAAALDTTRATISNCLDRPDLYGL